MLNQARASVDDVATWVRKRCTDEELVLFESARHHLTQGRMSTTDRLRREADLLMRWSATLAVAEASIEGLILTGA